MPINDILTGAKELWKRHLPTIERGPQGTTIVNVPGLTARTGAGAFAAPMAKDDSAMVRMFANMIPDYIIRDPIHGKDSIPHEMMHIGQRRFKPSSIVNIQKSVDDATTSLIGVPNSPLYGTDPRTFAAESPAYAVSSLDSSLPSRRKVAYDQLIETAKAADREAYRLGMPIEDYLWPNTPPGPGVQALRQITKKPLVHPK